MRRFIISLSLAAMALAAPIHAFSQAADTSTLFLNAYMANEEGQHLEGSGETRKALSKYHYAASLLDQISKDDPGWQPIVVEYRKKKVGENIARLQQLQSSQEAPAATPSGPAPMEGELPSKGNEGNAPEGNPPENPPVAPPPSSNNPGAGLSQQAQERINELQLALRDSRKKLQSVQDEKQQLADKLSDALKQLDGTKISVTELRGQLKQAQDAYQNSLTDHNQTTQTAQQARIKQLEDALHTAEADRDAADEQLSEQSRRTAQARKGADAATAQVKQIETKYPDTAKLASELEAANKRITSIAKERDDANERADDLEGRLSEAARAETKLATAQKEIADLTKNRDTANQQFADLNKKLAAASKDTGKLADAQQQIADLTQQRDAAKAKSEDLGKKLENASEATKKLADAQDQITTLKAGAAKAEKQNKDLTGQLADVHKQINQLTEDRDSARKQVTSLDGKLADAQKEVASVKADRDQIAAERDKALADLGKAREAQKHVDQLIAQNATLMQKVAADEKTIANFKSDSPEKDKQIADLRKEVSDTKAMLTSTQQDRDNIQSTLNDLQQQYDSATADLAEIKANSTVNASERKTLTDENDLLRGIVLRELKQQARRDQAKRQVMTELTQLQVQSDTLLSQIDLLGQPVVQLTDKEKALFKDPFLQVPDADDTTHMDITIAAPKQPGSGHESTSGTAVASASPSAAPNAVSRVATPSPTPMEVAKLDNSTPAPGSANTPPPEKPDNNYSVNAGNGTTATSRKPLPTGAMAQVPSDLMDDARAARNYTSAGRYLDAEKLYEKMLAKTPNNVYILSNLGVAYYHNQKYKLAEESLKKAIAVAPEDVFSHCTLGIVYYQQKRYDDAINSLTRSLAIDPRYAVAHNYLGITASQKGWQEAALKELETAVQIDPNYADASFNLAVVYIMQTPPNKELARKYYKRATELGAEPDANLEKMLQ